MKVYIFDMDGTFIDSMDYWNNLMTNFLEEKGLNAHENLQMEILNMPLLEGVSYVKERYDMEGTVEDIYREIKELIGYNYKKVFKLDPDAKDIFNKIKEKGDKLVLATATQRSLVNLVLERFKIDKCFDLEIVSDEVDLHKDDSKYYENIANYFNVNNEDCIVVEDALYAIESAKKIGMKTVGILEQTPQVHREKIRSLTEISGQNLGDVKDYFLNNEK